MFGHSGARMQQHPGPAFDTLAQSFVLLIWQFPWSWDKMGDGNINCGQAAGCANTLRLCMSEPSTQHSNRSCTTGLLYPFSGRIASPVFGK